MEVVYLNQTEFRKTMLSLRQSSGAHQRAFDEACRIIEALRLGVDVSNKITKWGESRIPHCVKYDISNDHHRLVTVQTDSFIYLLFVGKHEDVERWLDRNRGLKITASKGSKEIRVTHVTESEPSQWREVPQQDFTNLTEANVPYLKRIPGFGLTEFIVQPFLANQLLRLDENSSDGDIETLLSFVAEQEPEIGNLLFDLVCEVRAGNVDAAVGRLEQYKGDAKAVEEDKQLESEAVNDTINSDRIKLLGKMTDVELKRLFSPDAFLEWILFPHPEQERIATKTYSRPVVLTGVSGSGKTCVLVHRARHLAKLYSGERIGLLTLNRSLSRLLQNLVSERCTEQERSNIVVMAFYDYLALLVEHFGPDEYLGHLKRLAESHEHRAPIQQAIGQVDRKKFAREFDPLSGEELDDTWNLFLNQAHVRTGLSYFADHLFTYQTSIDPDQYLREEFSLIRSAMATQSRETEYLEMEREGRAIAFPAKIRKLTLELLLVWEEVMLSGGVLDELSLTAALLPSRTKLRELPAHLRFRSLLIDEFQDFSTLDLALLRQIPTASENGFFVAGDPVQRVLVKSLRMGAVGLDIISAERERITKNYRNSRQILLAASKLANKFGELARKQNEEIELLDPELAVRETAPPFAVEVEQGRELERAWQLACECLSAKTAVPWSINIATASPSVISVEAILASKPANLDVKAARISGDYTRSKDTLTVGTVSDVKGFEFTVIIILGCGREQLPVPGRCKDEAWRDALRLYVAMTRGRDQVHLIYSGEPSELLDVMKADLKWEHLVAEATGET